MNFQYVSTIYRSSMRLRLVILAALFLGQSVYASPCQNFGGDYELEDVQSSLELVISQTDCREVKFNFGINSPDNLEVMADGQKRKLVAQTDFTYVVSANWRNARDLVFEFEIQWTDGNIDRGIRRWSLVDPDTLVDEIGRYRIDGMFVSTSQVIYRRKKKL